MPDCADDAFFNTILQLGSIGTLEHSDFKEQPDDRLARHSDWLGPARDIGANSILLGPDFDSSRHGYDTADLFTIDRRLGTKEAFAAWCREAHGAGFRVVLDGVFHHVGRDFWAFRDVLAHGEG